MSKPTDIFLREARTDTHRIRFRTPLKFGGRVMTDTTLLEATVTVETRDGRRQRGFGSMPMGNVWAWPSAQVAADEALAAMIDFGRRFVENAARHEAAGHPIEIMRELSHAGEAIADKVTRAAGLAETMPHLARLVAASPLDAAVHDAYGRALGRNSYDVLGPEFVNCDLAAYLTPEFAGEYLDRYTRRRSQPRMPLYHLVGALDPLTAADVSAAVDDGLPETLPEWIAFNGLTHLKIKMAGDDLRWDIDRMTAVDRVAAEAQSARGCAAWFYSVDFNEKCPNVDYVIDFLGAVKERSPAALQRLQYIEQPTSRDLRANPENRMHRAARLKPVVIDESLVDLESLLLSRELGYSGVALKTCKGHSDALLMAAAAQKYGMFLCVQDLTCPGASFLHSAGLAARIPGVAAVEGNGRQFCPDGNRGWTDRFPSMFQITDGTVETAVLDGPGLGFSSFLDISPA